jgi:hypothetical protein
LFINETWDQNTGNGWQLGLFAKNNKDFQAQSDAFDTKKVGLRESPTIHRAANFLGCIYLRVKRVF